MPSVGSFAEQTLPGHSESHSHVGLAMCQPLGVRPSQECVLSAGHVPLWAEFPCGQGSSTPPQVNWSNTGLYQSTRLQAAPAALALGLTFLPPLPQVHGLTGWSTCFGDVSLLLVRIQSMWQICMVVRGEWEEQGADLSPAAPLW